MIIHRINYRVRITLAFAVCTFIGVSSFGGAFGRTILTALGGGFVVVDPYGGVSASGLRASCDVSPFRGRYVISDAAGAPNGSDLYMVLSSPESSLIVACGSSYRVSQLIPYYLTAIAVGPDRLMASEGRTGRFILLDLRSLSPIGKGMISDVDEVSSLAYDFGSGNVFAYDQLSGKVLIIGWSGQPYSEIHLSGIDDATAFAVDSLRGRVVLGVSGNLVFVDRQSRLIGSVPTGGRRISSIAVSPSGGIGAIVDGAFRTF